MSEHVDKGVVGLRKILFIKSSNEERSLTMLLSLSEFDCVFTDVTAWSDSSSCVFENSEKYSSELDATGVVTYMFWLAALSDLFFLQLQPGSKKKYIWLH